MILAQSSLCHVYIKTIDKFITNKNVLGFGMSNTQTNLLATDNCCKFEILTVPRLAILFSTKCIAKALTKLCRGTVKSCLYHLYATKSGFRATKTIIYMSSADKLCKQFGPRSGLTKFWA